MRVWLTPKYSLKAPEPREAVEAKGGYLRFADGWSYFGCAEGEFWHRKYSNAAKVARANRDAWLRELTQKAAAITALPPIPEKAA
jgi:hypothetical protein